MRRCQQVPATLQSRSLAAQSAQGPGAGGELVGLDAKVLELGSFNYTQSAEEKNAENVLVLRNRSKVIKDYAAQWQKLWNEGE